MSINEQSQNLLNQSLQNKHEPVIVGLTKERLSEDQINFFFELYNNSGGKPFTKSQKDTLILYLRGYSISEVIKKLGISQDAVSQRMATVYKNLNSVPIFRNKDKKTRGKLDNFCQTISIAYENRENLSQLTPKKDSIIGSTETDYRNLKKLDKFKVFLENINQALEDLYEQDDEPLRVKKTIELLVRHNLFYFIINIDLSLLEDFKVAKKYLNQEKEKNKENIVFTFIVSYTISYLNNYLFEDGKITDDLNLRGENIKE